MTKISNGHFRKIIALIMIFSLCIGMIPNFGVVEQTQAASTYKYTRVFIKGGGDISSRFSIEVSDKKLTGLCRNGGPMSSDSGSAYISRLDDNDTRKYLAYYYGYKLGWTSGSNGCDLARAFHYATYGSAYHQSASRSKEMIENATTYCKNNGIPDNFVAYNCNPSNGSQEFIAWGYYPPGKMKIVKKSSNTDISKAPGYTFKGIKYKVYEKKSTSSKCYGTLTLKAGGSSGYLSLSPDGPNSKTYYVKESETNDWYELNDNWYQISISPGESKTLNVKDTPKKGSLTFKKALTSDTVAGSSKAGFKFTLVNTKNTTLKYTATSGSDGTVTFTKLPLGTYKLTENLTDTQKKNQWKSITGTVNPITIKSGSNTLPTSTGTYINERKIEDPDLIIYKTTSDNSDVEGFSFTATNTETGKTYTGTTNEEGMLEFKNIPAGTYTVTENLTNDQKAKYIQPASQTDTLEEDSDENLVFTFENTTRDPVPVKIKKTSSDGNIAGMEFEITGTKFPGTIYEEEIPAISGVTDSDGYFDVGELEIGNYVVQETGWTSEYMNNYPLSGYDYPARAFSITEDGLVIGNKVYSTGVIEFVNTSYRIKLKKTEILVDGTKTSNPVADAGYDLYKVTDTGEEFVNSFVTDSNGEIEIWGVEKGEYILKEMVVPAGYVEQYDETGNLVPYEISVTVNDKNNGVAEVTATNKQKYGSVFVVKTDDIDQPVKGAEITLYTNAACTTIATDASGNKLTGITDDYGYLLFENLPWRTYYVKETNAPRGYELNDEPQKLEIGKDSSGNIIVDKEIKIINNRIPGSVILTKADTDGNTISSPAVYSLYKSDGTLVKSGLTTGADNNGDGKSDGTGKIHVDGLEWGSYYFLETVPPAGYALSDEKITFSVNYMSCNSPQYKTAKDKELIGQIIATKKILAKDLWYKHGTPTFIFELSGTAATGETKTYHRTVTFSEEYANEHTDENGYVSMSVSFNDIPVGDYVLSEEPVIRYTLDEIERSSLINGTISGDTVIFKLSDTNKTGAATFINEKYEWQDYSETKLVNNAVKKQRTYTGLYAEYNGNVFEANMPISDFTSYLDVWAIYDDGTTKELGAGDYTVMDVDGNAFTQTPHNAGSYDIFITYEENGISNTCTIRIQVAPPVQLTVTFNTNGGNSLNPMTVYKYNTLAGSTNDSTKYTPTKTDYRFDGWYKDADLTQPFDVKNDRITENITLYAKWKNLYDYWALRLSDGTLVMAYMKETDVNKGVYNGVSIAETYQGFDTAVYSNASSVPWYDDRASIKSVVVADTLKPASTSYWFYGMTNCENADLAKLDTTAASMTSMFNGMTNLEYVTVGTNFKWQTNHALPTPSSAYINYADGYWYAESNSIGYTAANLPNSKADTYYAFPIHEVLASLQTRAAELNTLINTDNSALAAIEAESGDYLKEENIKREVVSNSGLTVNANGYTNLMNIAASDNISSYSKILGTVGHYVTGTYNTWLYPYSRYVTGGTIHFGVRNHNDKAATGIEARVHVLYIDK